MGLAESTAVAAVGAAFENGMADKAAREPYSLEIRWLKGQQCHQVIVPTCHPPGAACSPSPNHWRDVVDEGKALAAPTQPMRDAPAEPRAVDCHDGIRAKRADGRNRLADTAKYDRSPGQDLGYTHNRQLLERHKAL